MRNTKTHPLTIAFVVLVLTSLAGLLLAVSLPALDLFINASFELEE
jgi:hypothetical protein